MPIYAKLPETIDAQQWDGVDPQVVIDWAGPTEAEKLSYDPDTNTFAQAWDGPVTIEVGMYLCKDYTGTLAYPWFQADFENQWGPQ